MTPLRAVFQFTPDGFFEKVTARVTGSPVHCGLILPTGELVQSSPPNGVTVSRPPISFPELDPGWKELTVPDADATKLIAFAQGEVGCKYDCLGVALGWTFGHTSKSRWYCSELAAYMLTLAGVALDRQNPAKYTPKRLWTELSARYKASA